MLQLLKKIVVSYDLFLILIVIWIIHLFFHPKAEVIVENRVSTDRIDPKILTNKELFSLLNSRGEVYFTKTDRSRLEALAKTKVKIEESNAPVSANLHSLTVQELKRLLDERGIMYYRGSTKEDLITAVNISGPVTKEAVDHMNRIGEPKLEAVHEFNAFNFLETLNKYNDSIFLINILPPRIKFLYFHESSWNALRRKLSYMDFKFGELDCDFEKSICLRNKWNTSTLYLYTPVIEPFQVTIREDYSIHNIFTLIQQTISSRITHIKSWDEFTSSNFTFYDYKKGPPVRVILFTNMTTPPLFLSSLSIKYKNKVNFGMVNMASRKGRTILRKLKQAYWPLCLIVTKQTIMTYGKLPGEYFTYRDLDIFLETLLRDFKPVQKWYHKLDFLLDTTLIGLLLMRFLARNFLLNV